MGLPGAAAARQWAAQQPCSEQRCGARLAACIACIQVHCDLNRRMNRDVHPSSSDSCTDIDVTRARCCSFSDYDCTFGAWLRAHGSSIVTEKSFKLLFPTACCRAAGGVPVAVALLGFGADRRIVRDALAVLSALMCGEGVMSAWQRRLPLSPGHLQSTGMSTVRILSSWVDSASRLFNWRGHMVQLSRSCWLDLLGACCA